MPKNIHEDFAQTPKRHKDQRESPTALGLGARAQLPGPAQGQGDGNSSRAALVLREEQQHLGLQV